MLALILKRLLSSVPMILGSSLIVFCIFTFSNIDPVRRMLGERSQNEELVQQMRESFGLNRPAPVRYASFIAGVCVGDFGKSMVSRQPVTKHLREYFPATLELTMAALFVSVAVGLVLGSIAAFKRNSWIDFTAMGLSLVAVSMPVFWLALMLSYWFSEKLGWFPLSQRYSLEYSGAVPVRTGLMLVDSLLARRFDVFVDSLHHLALPAITLAMVTSAFVARMTRSSVLEVLRQDYVRTAVAKGLRTTGQWKHVLRNALVPIVTIVGLEIPALLGGAVITETIYSWPGMGKFIVESTLTGDVLAVQGAVMFLTLIFIGVNLVVDLLYVVIDPRIRMGAAATEG